MKFVLGLVLLFCVSFPALGQVPTGEEPGHQVARFAQPAGAQSKPGALISLPSSVAPEGAARILLYVTSINIVGSTIYSDKEFASLLAAIVGKDVTLAALYDLAQKLTAKYGNDGYVLSRAIVPPQSLDPRGARVTIQIVEGYVDAVQWPSEPAHDQKLFAEYGTKITAQRPANIKTIMRYLLLADNLPGLSVTSRFQASAANPNASTLIVDTAVKHIDAYSQLDNRGTPGRGPWEFSDSATFNDVLGLNEALTIIYSGAAQVSELQSLGLSYTQVLNSEGLSIFSDANKSWGAPDTPDLTAVEYNAQSFTWDLGLKEQAIRSRDLNLSLSEQVFLSDNEAEMLGAPSSDDRLRGVRVGANYDSTDSSNGTTEASATFSHGFVGFGSSSNGDPLLSREHGRVDFSKIEVSASRTQQLGKGFSVVAATDDQYAFTPLLSPEECTYGGSQFGRGFDPSELSGDSCVDVSGEARFDPAVSGALKQLELYGFADYGAIFRIAPSVGTPANASGASTGVGVRVAAGSFSADLSAVKPLFGRTDDDWRYFLTSSARY